VLLLLMISGKRECKPRDEGHMLECEDEGRRQMNSMTMLYNTNLSLLQCSAEAIAFLAPVWCCALEALGTTFGGMTRGG
jgi:hypothetical protein